MKAIIIETKSKADEEFWLKLAGKTGNKAKSFSKEEIEDLGLAMMIKEGMDSDEVERDLIMKELKK